MLFSVLSPRRSAVVVMSLAVFVTMGCSTARDRSNEPMTRAEFMQSQSAAGEAVQPAEPAVIETRAPIFEAPTVIVIPRPTERIEIPSSTERDEPVERTLAPRATAPERTHPAAQALLNEATRQEKSGDYERAAAKLERALRIEPRNALLWHRLADLRLRQGKNQLAANLAAKSNSYAAANSELVELNQRIIATSKKP